MTALQVLGLVLSLASLTVSSAAVWVVLRAGRKVTAGIRELEERRRRYDLERKGW